MDQFEFAKFDEPHEIADHLLSIATPKNSVDTSSRRNCPKCLNIVMMRIFHSPKRVVEIDECPGCRSIWLDYGELSTIRTLFPSEESLKEARVEAFQNEMGSEMEKYQRDKQSKANDLKRFANLFSWLTKGI